MAGLLCQNSQATQVAAAGNRTLEQPNTRCCIQHMATVEAQLEAEEAACIPLSTILHASQFCQSVCELASRVPFCSPKQAQGDRQLLEAENSGPHSSDGIQRVGKLLQGDGEAASFAGKGTEAVAQPNTCCCILALAPDAAGAEQASHSPEAHSCTMAAQEAVCCIWRVARELHEEADAGAAAAAGGWIVAEPDSSDGVPWVAELSPEASLKAQTAAAGGWIVAEPDSSDGVPWVGELHSGAP